VSDEAKYPPSHKPAMKVPKGGSSCCSCTFLAKDEKSCTNKYFIAWHGSAMLPAPADEYCSDWYIPEKKATKDESASSIHPFVQIIVKK
jgi:hypothetical protein